MIEDIEIVSVRNPVPISEKTYYSDTSYDVTLTSTKDVVFYYTLFEKPEEIGTCDEEFIYFRNDQKPFYAGLDSNSKQKNLIISDKNKTVCGYVIVAAPSYTIENTNFHRYYSTYEQDYRSSFAIKMGPQNIKDFDILYSLPFYPAGDIKFRKSEIIYHTDLITVQSNVTNDYSSTSALNGYYEYYYRINIPKDGLDLNFDKCTLVFHNGPKFTMVEKGGKEFLGNTGIDVINATSPAFFTIKPLNESETYHELNLTISNPSEYSFHDIYVIPPNDFNFYVLVHNEDQYKNILTNISAFKRMKFNIEIHNLHSFNHLTWSNKGRYESENEITKGSIISRIQYNSGHDLYTKSFSAYRSVFRNTSEPFEDEEISGFYKGASSLLRHQKILRPYPDAKEVFQFGNNIAPQYEGGTSLPLSTGVLVAVIVVPIVVGIALMALFICLCCKYCECCNRETQYRGGGRSYGGGGGGGGYGGGGGGGRSSSSSSSSSSGGGVSISFSNSS